MMNSSLSLVELSPLLSISPTQEGLFWGILVSIALAVASFFALRWSVARSYGTFLNVLFGGMLARLVVIGGAMVWVWQFSTMNAVAFTIAVLAGYVVFQVIEVFVAQKQVRSARLVRPAGK
jgi:peptidoglycan/LPS O-acetylase OafA/YrhL